jgi:hypothetical protein
MSYCIKVSYLEKETLCSVEIYNSSEESRAVRRSQFQCIGWLLEIFDFARSKVDEHGLLNPEYEQEALERIACLTAEEATALLALKTPKSRFEYVWEILCPYEREIALWGFVSYDNYWPGFDTYSRLWSANLSAEVTDDPKPHQAIASVGNVE